MDPRDGTGEGRLGALMASLGRLVADHPGKVVLAFLLLTAVMFPPLLGMDTSTSMEDFTPESEFLEGADVLRSEFDPVSPAIMIVEAKDGSITDREGLMVLWSIQQAVLGSEELAPYLSDGPMTVVTIAGPVAAYLHEVSNGTLDISSASDVLLEQAVQFVSQDPSVSVLVSQGGEGRYALVVVNLLYPSDGSDQEAVEKALETVVEDTLPNDYRLHSFLAFSEKMQQDTTGGLALIMPLALLLVVVVLWLALRSLVDVLISVAGVVSIMVISMGLYSLTGLGFSQLLFFGPILILVLSIDFAIHVLYRYNEHLGRGEAPRSAMAGSIGMVGVAVLVSALTTAVAFASNGLSSIPAVSGFGVFLGLGIFVSFAVMVLFVPATKLLVGSRSSAPERRTRRVGRGALTRMVRVSNAYPVAVVTIATVLFAGSLMVVGDIPNDMSARDALSADSEVIQAMDILEAEFPVTGSARAFVIIMGDVTDPANMAAIDEFLEETGRNGHVATIEGEPSMRSVVPLVKAATVAMDNGTGLLDADGDGIPDTREGLTAVLQSLWSDGLEGTIGPDEVQKILSVDGDGGSFDGILVAMETTSRDARDTGPLLETLREDLRPLERREDIQVHLAGSEFEGYQMTKGMTDGMMRSTLVTILVCTLIVILLMRSVRLGLITAVPIVLITGWILGLMYVMGYSLNMVTASITAMTVGVGMDFSIHIMERYREERRSGQTVGKAMERTLSTTGVSLTAAAATTLFGFLVIGTSDISMFRTFGVLSAIMISMSLISAMFVLPAMITLGERTLRRGAGTEDGEGTDPDEGNTESLPEGVITVRA